MNHGIYIIEHTASARRYVGSAVDLENRLAAHRSLLRADKHKNRYLQAAWRKYGEDAFVFGFLEFIQHKEELVPAEQAWIDALNCVAPHGFNLAPKAGSSLGVVHSDEYRKRISEIKRGNTYRLGMRHSEETKRRISEKSRGRKQSPELIERRIAPLRGRKRDLSYMRTPETQARRAAAIRAFYATPEGREIQRTKWRKRYGVEVNGKNS